MRISSLLHFGAMVPFGIVVATTVSRLFFHGVRVAGVHIALFGGSTAAVLHGSSDLAGWVLSQLGVAADVGAMRAVQLLTFASGGFGHVVALGLFLAGVSVPCLVFVLIPRWIAWTGLVIAEIAEISVLSMAIPALSILLPIARFPAYLWMIAVGFTLPNRRRVALGEESGFIRPMMPRRREVS